MKPGQGTGYRGPERAPGGRVGVGGAQQDGAERWDLQPKDSGGAIRCGCEVNVCSPMELLFI